MLKNYRKILSASLISLFFCGGYLSLNCHQKKLYAQETKQINTEPLKRPGDFTLIYKSSDNQLHQAFKEGLEQTKIFQILTDHLIDSGLIMRTDVTIIFRDCGEANAFYRPDNYSITMCYDLISQVAYDLQKINQNPTPEEALLNSLYASIFVFYHELGHALIDILELPAVGKEEDAVDQFSAFMLINSGDKELSDEAIFNAAVWFGQNPDVPAWDEHAPNDVRFYNLLCLVYGSNPSEYPQLVEYLNNRADRCDEEFKKAWDSWNQLLLPHFAKRGITWGTNSNSDTAPSSPSSAPVNRPPGKRW